jgi:hypothetical protein
LFNQIEPSLAGMIVGKEKRGYANEVDIPLGGRGY